MNAEKFIGCSGYYYNHWKGIFYPETLHKKLWLPFYAEHFNTVEINSSFYHMPLDSTLQNWHDITPSKFIFTLKGSRFITHIKKLNVDAVLKEAIYSFESKARIMKDKLGCILWQLPKSQKSSPGKLEGFCKLLDRAMHHVMEFRDSSWYTEENFDILRHFNISLCILSSPGVIPSLISETSDVAYFRFHGSTSWYDSNYSIDELEKWKVKAMALKSKVIYAYFNNDINGYAVFNAEDFARMLNDKTKEAA